MFTPTKKFLYCKCKETIIDSYNELYFKKDQIYSYKIYNDYSGRCCCVFCGHHYFKSYRSLEDLKKDFDVFSEERNKRYETACFYNDINPHTVSENDYEKYLKEKFPDDYL